MESLAKEFGLTIVDPAKYVSSARSTDQAFTRFLKECSDRVLQLKVASDTETLFAPGPRQSARIATEFEVDAVVRAADRPLGPALSSYRSLLDRTMIPDTLERKVAETFKTLCEKAQSDDDLQALSNAVSNMNLSAEYAMEAIAYLFLAINRNNPPGLPRYPVICPLYGDAMSIAAVTYAIVLIRQDGGKIGDAIRMHMRMLMPGYKKLPENLQAQVRTAAELAWADGNGPIPPDLFMSAGPFAPKSFEEIMADFFNNLPKGLGRPK